MPTDRKKKLTKKKCSFVEYSLIYTTESTSYVYENTFKSDFFAFSDNNDDS